MVGGLGENVGDGYFDLPSTQLVDSEHNDGRILRLHRTVVGGDLNRIDDPVMRDLLALVKQRFERLIRGADFDYELYYVAICGGFRPRLHCTIRFLRRIAGMS